MSSYLEAYRLSRAKALERETQAAAEPSDKHDITAVQTTPRTTPAKSTAGKTAPPPTSKDVSSSTKSENSNPLSSRSFAAAKLSVDRVQGNNEEKTSKDKVLKWQTKEIERGPRDMGGNSTASSLPKAIDRPSLIKKSDIALAKAKQDKVTADTGPRKAETPTKAQTPPREIPSASTPRKRIVSDEHWLSDRTSPQAPQGQSLQQTGLPLRGAGLYTPPGATRPEAWVRRKSTPARRDLPSAKKHVSFEDGGDRENPIGGRNSNTALQTRSRQASNPIGVTRIAGEAKDQKKKETPLTRQSIAGEKLSATIPQSAPPKLGRLMGDDLSPQAANPDGPPRIKGAWTRKRPPRRDSFSSGSATDEAGPGPGLAKNTLPKTSNGRLGAWLSQTPDPFVDKFEDPLTAAVKPMSIGDAGSIIAPRKTNVRGEHRARGGQRLKSFSENNTPSQSDSDDRSIQSSPALKRSGAYRDAGSPTRNANGEYSSMKLQLAAAIVPKAALRPRRQETNQRPNANRNLASHADLMSVLSQTHGRKGLVSARTIRTSRKKLGNATITDLMDELRSDEAKYIRELRTLVDGVIPVLLNSVISKNASESSNISWNDSSSTVKSRDTIVGLGVALDRLYKIHKTIPTKAPVDFTDWAERARPAYEHYITTWKLGFQNVVVNLAPADFDGDQEGFTDGGRGERVDVAFLLKRPLVRIKYLAKVLKGVDQILASELAGTLAAKYETLIEETRFKQDKEHARLEDEAASSVDATKVRDPETLAPVSGIRVNRNRCVRARDVFDMTMQHSSGQRLDCHVMLFLRDDLSGYGNRGDLLVSELDSSSRWLLFPPAELPQVSARRGKTKREIVVMLRGSSSLGQEWRELMSLEANTEANAAEWVKMLGSSPLPPPIPASKGFKDTNHLRRDPGKALVLAGQNSMRPPSPSEIDVPIGEQSVVSFDSEMDHRRHLPPPRYHDRSAPGRSPPSPARVRLEDAREKSYSTPVTPRRDEPYDNDWRADIATAKVDGWLSEGRGRQASGARHELQTREGRSDYMNRGETRNGQPQRPMVSRQLPTVPSEGLLAIGKNRDGHATSERLLLRGDRRIGPHQTFEDSRRGISTRSSPIQQRGVSTPHLSPSKPNTNMHRRSSSPLKYEYDPSSGSDASSVMADLVSDDDGSVTSESSIDDIVPDYRIQPYAPRGERHRSASVERFKTNGPYNKAFSPPNSPQGQQQPKNEPLKLVASIYTWSDKGMWKLLHPDECSIVVTPGIIEAFEMTAAHSAPSQSSAVSSSRRGRDRPLVALELTPLVPLRQSTAVDITIRSPPTANSQIRTGNNIMFRSRTGGDCELLYSMINQARINNPTYVALQNARGPAGGSNWASFMDQQASKRGGSLWWRLGFGSRKSSYRAGNTRRSTSIGETVTSATSISSAMSALMRFSGASNVFNVGKSTVFKRDGSSNERSSVSYESSSGSSTPIVLDPSQGTPAGITDMKIRLYEREEASKWRDRGPARLTIMHPPRPNATMISPTGHVKQEKRILIVGKTRGETLLDVTLEESSFERVARTGVAVKVWERFDQMGSTGGVACSRMKVYMIQLKSEAEAAYTFSLVGRLRY